MKANLKVKQNKRLKNSLKLRLNLEDKITILS